MTDADIDALLAAALRDGTAAWPAGLRDADAERIRAAAVFYGVATLLHTRMAANPEPPPGRLADELPSCALGAAMRERDIAGLVAELVERNLIEPRR